jgi:hypothetical protein
MSARPTINDMARAIRDELRNAVFSLPAAEDRRHSATLRIAEVEAITFSHSVPVYRVRCTNGEAHEVQVRFHGADGENPMGYPTSHAAGYDIIPFALGEPGQSNRAEPQGPA